MRSHVEPVVTDLPEGESYAGVFPITPTPFTAAGDLDPDGQRRVLDCMVDQGVDGWSTTSWKRLSSSIRSC